MINGEGVCTSFWTQGCPHRCPGCHNPATWSFCGGYEAKPEILIAKVLNAIGANGIQRNLSILGGEPLCEENVDFVCELLAAAKEKYLRSGKKLQRCTGFSEPLSDKRQNPPITETLSGLDCPFTRCSHFQSQLSPQYPQDVRLRKIRQDTSRILSSAQRQTLYSETAAAHGPLAAVYDQSGSHPGSRPDDLR